MAKKKRKGWVAEPEELLRAEAGFDLAELDPDSTPGFEGDEDSGEKVLARDSEDLSELQELLFANGRSGDSRAILLVLQAMDTAGKGGIVRHVVGQVDPQGVKIAAFKKPTEEELSHDFLWRIRKQLPEAGIIGVFDRSHYEDVLVAKVRQLADQHEIDRRYQAINEFEAELIANGTKVIKVMLHISKEEQGDRLLERLNREDKHWKFSANDIAERKFWQDYQQAFQLVFEKTSTELAPWHVVPANNKWYARLAVQQLLIGALEDLELDWPKASFDVEETKRQLLETI